MARAPPAWRAGSPHMPASRAAVIRFSDVRRSGVNPGTTEPGGPLFPPGGVTPPGPAKYGTFASRWFPSTRKVTNWLGMKSNVIEPSHAL